MRVGASLRRKMMLIALVLAAHPGPSWAQRDAVLAALQAAASQLHIERKYDEAVPIAERYVALTRERLGEDHLEFATAAALLARVYQSKRRYAESGPLYRSALAIRQRLLAPTNALVGRSLYELAGLYLDEGRFAEAEPLCQRALEIAEQTLPEDHLDLGEILKRLMGLQFAVNKIEEAAQSTERVLRIKQKQLGNEHPEIATLLYSLGYVYQTGGRLTEAEERYKRSLAIRERTLPADHPDIATSLVYLAHLYLIQDRLTEAELFSTRALAIYEKALPADHPDIANGLNNVGNILVRKRNYAEAEQYYARALAIRQRSFAPDAPAIAQSMSNLALVYLNQKRFSEAEALLIGALQIFERTRSSDRHQKTVALANLARVYGSQGDLSKAEATLERVLTLEREMFSANHPSIAQTLKQLGELSLAREDWRTALQHLREASAILINRGGNRSVGRTDAGENEIRQRSLHFHMHALIAFGSGTADAATRDEGFQMAQWADRTTASAALSKMAARQAKTEGPLAGLVRELQDLEAQITIADTRLSTAVGRANTNEATAIRDQIANLEARWKAIDERLARDYQEYAALAVAKPMSIAAVQAQLRADEALVLFLNTPAVAGVAASTLVWIVTVDDARWVKTALGAVALAREVGALRCGADASLWQDDSTAARCRAFLKAQPTWDRNGSIRAETLPFDQARAHALYKSLFGQVEDLIRGKHLLVVPAGPLTQLPLQVLVTSSPDEKDFKTTAWLARQNPITVLPAVSSLEALRRVAKPSAATKAMIGIGNPLLDGDPAERPWEAEWAKLARQKQACPQTPWKRVAAVFERRRGVVPMATRSGRPDLDHLRVQAPLHDTADELCAVAKDLKLAPDDIVLGGKATEATVKRLSIEGRLASYRVLHFATHGTLSGEISGTSEPGLILTPPVEQTEVDDGYLSASEVADLKLDADWVILSACNTAAGGASGAEALSGLARAFFYAGARAMLVSHWAVDSAATVKLITHAVGATTRDKTLGRAEALRRAMLAMIDKGEAREAHPAFWAPFVVVGEGAGDAMGQVIGAALPHGTKAVRKPPRKSKEDWSSEIWKKQAY